MSERKVLRTEYTGYYYFPIPTGLDLDDDTIVMSYYVRWDTLHIRLVNGNKIQIELGFESPMGTKSPNTQEFLEAEDCPVDDEEFDKADELLKQAKD